MRNALRNLLCLAAAAALAVAWAPAADAQGVTTGAISGQATDSEGGALPGSTITAVHLPTGTRYVVVTRADGSYLIAAARVGGPYTATAGLEGFTTQEKTDIFVRLGQAVPVDFTLELGAIEETVTVVGQADTLFSSTRTGAASNVSLAEIESLPTVGRGLEDFARTNPFMTVTSNNADPDSISVAGRNSRYNNIQIDGAVNNDLFGLADTGTPGGQADTTPISLDAIQEFELVIADFDVRQGGFSGGSVNAITRSGSNDWKGSVFYFTRDQDWVGDLPPESGGEFGTFEENQYGFRLGGPIARDRAFFFVNGEITEGEEPSGWSIDGSSGQAFQNGEVVAEAELFRQTLINRYGFDPGGLAENTRDNPSDKFFGRLDFNLADNHQLTLRHNYVDAENDINRPGPSVYEFPSETYAFTNETNSTVTQLNSVFGSNSFNEARLTYQTIKDRRAGRDGVTFPWIELENVLPGSGIEFEAGTENFSTKNALDQDIIEITDDFTWIRGAHTLVIGTHNELFTFDNLFIQNAFGAYEFDNMEDFLDGRAETFQFTIVPPGQPESQKFDVNQLGLYFGDQWAVRSNLSLTYGLRVDAPFFPDKPTRNPFTETTYGFRTDEIPDGEPLWQPRVGFNWDMGGNARQQLRGGAGIFAGRAPYVWISNNYARTGIEQQFIRVTTPFGQEPSIPFNPDPLNQGLPPGVVPSFGEFNLIDPDFEFPQLLRFNLAYDRELPWWNLVASIEGIYADSLEEIDYRNVNLRQVGVTPFDGRPVFDRVDSTVDGAFLITNTSEGESTNVAVKVERPGGRGVWGSVAYVYGDSESVNEGTSSRAISNWQFNEAVDPNNTGAATSDFEVEHRFTGSLSYRFNPQTKWPTTVSLYYNHQSGRPYAYVLGGFPSINGDRFAGNDLFYVPANENDVELVGGTWDQLNRFISANECLSSHRGEIAPRNCEVAPWNSTLDLHLDQAIPVGYGNLQLTFDMLNLANLFDDDSGQLRFVNFGALTVGNFLGTTPDGKPRYQVFNVVTRPETTPVFQTHSVRSRWRAKLGLRWTF